MSSASVPNLAYGYVTQGTGNVVTSGPEVLTWASIDFDGTLATSIWPEPGIGEPIQRNIAKVHELTRRGYKIVIHTARGWEAYKQLATWLTEHDVPFDMIVCGKLLARIYVDDRNIDANAAVWLPEYHGL